MATRTPNSKFRTHFSWCRSTIFGKTRFDHGLRPFLSPTLPSLPRWGPSHPTPASLFPRVNGQGPRQHSVDGRQGLYGPLSHVSVRPELQSRRGLGRGNKFVHCDVNRNGLSTLGVLSGCSTIVGIEGSVLWWAPVPLSLPRTDIQRTGISVS